jgi:glutamate N-acetyltransferase/amino-acid N-acetyltransferase
VSVTAAQGFSAAGIAAGIKESGNPDLALVVNNGPRRAAAGVFTSNRVKAAPVLWSEQVLKGGEVTAVVLNSGGANACTGPQGFQDTHATAEKAAEVLVGHSAGEIAVASTGLIGTLLPMDKLLPGIETAAAALSEHGGEKAAIAIKTTDTVHKTAPPSTGSTPTAACRPTTPCCCWPPVRAASPRSRASSRRPYGPSAPTWPGS